MQHDNENDPLPFLTLAALTANVMAFLLSKREEQAESEREDRERETDQRAKAEAKRREFLVA